MDNETKKLLSDIEMIKHTIDTPGWCIIEERMKGLIEDVCNIRNIDKALSTEEKLKQLEIREGSADLVEQWLESVKGDAEWLNEKKENTLSDTIEIRKD